MDGCRRKGPKYLKRMQKTEMLNGRQAAMDRELLMFESPLILLLLKLLSLAKSLSNSNQRFFPTIKSRILYASSDFRQELRVVWNQLLRIEFDFISSECCGSLRTCTWCEKQVECLLRSQLDATAKYILI